VTAVARERAIVAGAFAALAALATVWLAIDRTPPEWDHANHLERVVHCAADMARGDLRRIFERSTFYPPVVPCAAALVYRLARSSFTRPGLLLSSESWQSSCARPDSSWPSGGDRV